MMNKHEMADIKTLFTENAAKNAEPETETPDEEIQDEEITTEEDEDENLAEETGTEETVAEDEDETSEEEVLNEEKEEPFNVDSLTKAIDMEVSDFYDVLVPMPDGKDSITIGEMKNTYTQALRDNDALTAKVAEQEQAITNGTTAGAQAQQMSQLELQAQAEMMLVQREFNEVNFDELDASEPGQSALLRQKFQERYNNAQQVLQQAGYVHQQEQQQYVQDAHKKMLEIIPEWNDAEVLKSDQTDMNVAFLEAGYDQQTINSISDPVAMKLMRELVLLRKQKASSAKALQKVRKAPKPLKSNSKRVLPKKDATKTMVSKAKQSGNKHDQLNAVKALLSARNG
jgi:hypothetical protein